MKPQIQLIRLSIKLIFYFINAVRSQNWEIFDEQHLKPALKEGENLLEQIDNQKSE